MKINLGKDNENLEIFDIDCNFAFRHRLLVGEEAIAKTAGSAYYYAKDVINGRFELGESAIAKWPAFAYLYAKDIIRGRFLLGEKAIAKVAYHAYYYAFVVINGPWPEGEKAIFKSYCYRRQYEERFLVKIHED